MKTNVSLLLLGLGLACGSAYAGAVAEPMPVSNDINVTAPDQSGMWSFGGTAVLMQPTNKAFTYAQVSGLDVNGNVINSDIDYTSVDPSYHWWFGADITYAFPGNGRDVTLAYEGLHGTDTDHTSVPGPLGTSPVLASTLSGIPYLTAEGETDTRYDAGDLVFGQKFDVSSRIRLHPFIGLRYAHINTEDTGTYGGGSNTIPGRGVIFPTSTSSTGYGILENTFNGVGPRFGSDAQINLGQGFSVRGRLGLSALVGTRSVENSGLVNFYDATNAFVGVTNVDKHNDSETQVIPEIDGRLGLNYTYAFDSSMALGFEAGWQVTNYFDVIADQYGPPLTTAQHQYQDNSNFGLQGPYARLQLDIA